MTSTVALCAAGTGCQRVDDQAGSVHGNGAGSGVGPSAAWAPPLHGSRPQAMLWPTAALAACGGRLGLPPTAATCCRPAEMSRLLCPSSAGVGVAVCGHAQDGSASADPAHGPLWHAGQQRPCCGAQVPNPASRPLPRIQVGGCKGLGGPCNVAGQRHSCRTWATLVGGCGAPVPPARCSMQPLHAGRMQHAISLHLTVTATQAVPFPLAGTSSLCEYRASPTVSTAKPSSEASSLPMEARHSTPLCEPYSGACAAELCLGLLLLIACASADLPLLPTLIAPHSHPIAPHNPPLHCHPTAPHPTPPPATAPCGAPASATARQPALLC